MFGYNSQNVSSYERRIAPKKKKRKYSIEGSNNANFNFGSSNESMNNNLSINIIDRVLDLSKYNKETGLYTLCRDWINATTSLNDSTRTNSEQNKNNHFSKNNMDNSQKLSNSTESYDDSLFYISKLPEPQKMKEPTIKSLNQNIQINIRGSEREDLNLIEALNLNDEMVQTHALLKLHVNRWKSVRKEWSKYYDKTNQPYRNSQDVLKSIYEDV